MKPSATITVPEVLERFQNYYTNNKIGEWGSLHIVLADDNVDDNSVDWCLKHAIKINDTEGAELSQILLKMSKSQRLKISKTVR